MDDLISRQAAVDAVETIGFDFSDSGLSAAEIEEVCEAIGEVRQEWSRRIKRLPSAQQWIPVRERLPEINKPVLVWVYDEYYLSELHSIGGVLYWDFDQFDLSGDEFDDVIAWMPLPSVYREEGE